MPMKKIFFFIFLLLFSALPAMAEVRALLVGVSDYQDDSGIPDLRGPRNDVLLMRDILIKRGADDITLLAHDVEDANEPTHRAILESLEAMAGRSGPGDLVYIHLSGHGSRQIDRNGDETDGLDEVFLAADTRKADDGSNELPNALTDDEIGQGVLAIREKGADVWLVMDSCHSGSGLRATTDFSAIRNVDPQDLGINLSAANTDAESRRPETSLETREGMGRYLAFYATKSNDVAREVTFDGQANGAEKEWFGLFTAVLASQLDDGQSPTYRQVFQSVLSKLNRGAGLGAAAVQTPVWEGDLIDEPVLGGSGGQGVQRYLLAGDELDAGLVHGLTVGTLMALVADVTDPPEAVIGYAQIEEAYARQAFLRPVARDCRPESVQLCPSAGSLPAEAKAAQLELLPADRSISVSPVLNWQDQIALEESNPVAVLVAETLDSAVAQVGITVTRSPQTYDVQVAYKDNALWFAPETKLGSAPLGLQFDLGGDDERTRLLAIFVRILKAELFAQTLDNLETGNAFLNPSPVEVEARYFSSKLTDLTEPGAQLDVRKECRKALSKAAPDDFVALEDGDDFKQCDLLQFSARGTRDGQRDVNRIHIDAQYCINVAHELVEGTSEPRRVGNPMVMCSDCPGPVSYSAGWERLYFLIGELKDNREALNLTGLVENCSNLSDVTAGNRSTAASDLQSTLRKLGEQGATRGDMSGGFGLSDVWSTAYRWRVLPRQEAFARSSAE
ncbi:caspase family protein [Labrenzia sp. MBR-25]